MIFRVTKDRISKNIMKKTQYITNLPTLSQVLSTIFTYVDINLDIINIYWVVYKTIKKILQILIKLDLL